MTQFIPQIPANRRLVSYKGVSSNHNMNHIEGCFLLEQRPLSCTPNGIVDGYPILRGIAPFIHMNFRPNPANLLPSIKWIDPDRVSGEKAYIFNVPVDSSAARYQVEEIEGPYTA